MSIQQERIDILEDILTRLHHGATPDSVQEEFNEHFSSVSAIEIAAMEQQIINGPVPVTFEDVLKLCNVHAKMFQGSVKEGEGSDIDHPGHPVRVFKDENLALRSALMRIDNVLKALEKLPEVEEEAAGVYKGLLNQFKLLGQFFNHYERKEKLFFPKLEATGHTAPPKVMWAKDDEIRDMYKDTLVLIEQLPDVAIDQIRQSYESFEYEFSEMIFKEEAILINILLEALTPADWYQIAQESDAYGYTVIQPTEVWQPSQEILAEKQEDRKLSTSPITSFDEVTASLAGEDQKDPEVELHQGIPFKEAKDKRIPPYESNVQNIETKKIETADGYITVSWEPKTDLTPPNQKTDSIDFDQKIDFGNGLLSLNQVKHVLNNLPLEVTFVDNKEIFQYFNDISDPKNMIFKRTKAQIGRSIEFCHPPKSWPKVSRLIDDLRHGRREKESMWFERSDGVYAYVTYTGAYDENGEFKGIVESVQNIEPFLNLETPVKFELSPLEDEHKD